MFWPAIVIAVSSWWLLTGLALVLTHQSPRRARAGFMVVSIVAFAALLQVPFNAALKTPMAAATGFMLGLLIWSWLEISYLLGYVNGPNHRVYDGGSSAWRRFKGALATTIYHEAAALASVALLAAISVDQPNRTACYTVTVLCLMRWSAKLNLFFGVRAFNDRWLPDHLHYLTSYLRIGSASWFLPVSTLVGFFITFQIYELADQSNVMSNQLSLYLVASLMLLASIEHIFLLFPVNEAALWRWAKQDVSQIRAVKQES